ncbi:MAG: DUF4303 domain-containing protein [Clostridiaceae bacterium]
MEKSLKKYKEELKIAITNHYKLLNEKFGQDTVYGYSLYTDDDICSIGPVANRVSDITVSNNDEMYIYYKYSPDEWELWDDFELFDNANKIIKELYNRDDIEFIQYKESILDVTLEAIQELDDSGLFGIKNDARYLVIWISDSANEIMDISAKQLNTARVYEEYASEFIG